MLIIVTALFAGALEPATTTPGANPKDPVVCRRGDSEVGTHMRPKEVCMHQTEWDYVEKSAQRELRNLREHALDPGRGTTSR